MPTNCKRGSSRPSLEQGGGENMRAILAENPGGDAAPAPVVAKKLWAILAQTATISIADRAYSARFYSQKCLKLPMRLHHLAGEHRSIQARLPIGQPGIVPRYDGFINLFFVQG